MKGKTSLEIREIFGLERDDIRRLEKSGVLKPKKDGQGKASLFGMRDLDRLLDIKMYLLGGFRISDMPGIFTEDYDSDERIGEQIHIYKKRIQMLEFIRVMRSDLKAFEKLDQKKLIQSGRITAKNSNLPEYGTEEYFDEFWNFLKLVFIMDFLSQKESFLRQEIVLKKAMDAYHIIESILERSGIKIDSEEVIQVLLELTDSPIEEDNDLKHYVLEWVEEYRNSKIKIMEELEKESITPTIKGLDDDVKERFKLMMQHLTEFALDYFIDEEELFCIMKNFQQFIIGLDRAALEKGVVRLGDEK